MSYQPYIFLLTVIVAAASPALAQGPLPVSPEAALPLVTDEWNGVPTTYPEFPQFENFPELYFSSYWRNRCSEPSSDREPKVDSALKVDQEFLELTRQDGVAVQFTYCRGQKPLQSPSTFRDSEEGDYLFSVFDIGSEKSSILLSAFVESDGRTTLGKRILGYERTLTIDTADWEKLSEGVYSFTQILTKDHMIMELFGEAGDSDRQWETISHTFSYRRVLHLISINNNEVLQIVHTLPLADYEWSSEDEEPDLTNQLEVQLNYPTALEVSQIKQELSPQQQIWLGSFKLP